MPQVYGWYNLNGKSFLNNHPPNLSVKVSGNKIKARKSTCKDCISFNKKECYGNKQKICKGFQDFTDFCMNSGE